MSTATISTATVASVVTPANEVFERDGCLTLSSLTTPADIELIRSLLDPLFAKFDTLGDRAASEWIGHVGNVLEGREGRKDGKERNI